MELKYWSQFFIWFISIWCGLGVVWLLDPEGWELKKVSIFKISIIVTIVSYIAVLFIDSFIL